MIEILLTDLNKTNFYEETLKNIERICDEYQLGQHFGTLSMTNQMLCDFLDTKSDYSIDVSFQIDNNEVSFNYTLQSGDFRALSENQEENTALFVLRSLADEVIFSTDYNELTTTFHVKTKINIQRNLKQEKVRTLSSPIR